VAQGLVIVNADDWGLSEAVTDAILRCFEAGGITSASAMVWMPDSERAASLSRERGLPSGLHLNLDCAFAPGNAPQSVCSAQERIIPWFASPRRYRNLSYNASRPFRRSLDTTIEAQLDEFRARYGREPTHIDGHHHVHMAWNVLASKAIPDGAAMRTTRRQERASLPVRALRSLRVRWLRHRFRTTDYFYDLRRFGLADGMSGRTDLGLLQAIGAHTVEVMAHPAARDEFELLCSEEWSRLTGLVSTGSFDDLR
jgi:hypothetical protein